MKLKYRHYFLMIFLFYVVTIMFLTCLYFLYFSFAFFLVMLFIFTFFMISLFLMDANRYKNRKIGIKKQGYIIGAYCRHSGVRAYTQCLRVLLDNKIFLVCNISANKAYYKIINDFRNVEVVSDGIFMLKKIPIDIYIDGDSFFADLDSVKLD